MGDYQPPARKRVHSKNVPSDETSWYDDTVGLAVALPVHKSEQPNANTMHDRVKAAGPRVAEHGEVVRGSDYLAKVQKRLLCHGEMHQIRLEFIEQAGKLDLLERVKGELGKGNLHGCEVGTGHFPVVVSFDQNGVAVGFVDVLQVGHEPVGVAAGAGAPNARINNDMPCGNI